MQTSTGAIPGVAQICLWVKALFYYHLNQLRYYLYTKRFESNQFNKANISVSKVVLNISAILYFVPNFSMHFWSTWPDIHSNLIMGEFNAGSRTGISISRYCSQVQSASFSLCVTGRKASLKHLSFTFRHDRS